MFSGRNMIWLSSWACLGLFCIDSGARQIKPWPYDKLFKHADLVVIVKPLSVRDAKKDDRANPPEEDLFGIVTTFEIEHVVKGEYKEKKLDIVHFKLKEGVEIANGPLLVSFHTKPQGISGKGWSATLMVSEYMLFLKKTKDGRFEFVSGQIDPELSVKQMMKPLPNE